MTGLNPDWLVQHIVRRMVILAGLLTPPLLLAPFVSSQWVALGSLGVGFFLLATVMSSSLMPIQLYAQGTVRGRVTAIRAVCTSGLAG